MSASILTNLSPALHRRLTGLCLAVCLMLLLASCVSMPQAAAPDASGGEQATAALRDFLDALHSGAYDRAATFYGGEYSILQGWNPDVFPEDHALLLERGCAQNGLQCLELRQIDNTDQLDARTFRFEVKFSNPDGSLFRRGPCCGATEAEMPTQVSFAFTVQRQDDQYYVLDLPPYVP